MRRSSLVPLVITGIMVGWLPCALNRAGSSETAGSVDRRGTTDRQNPLRVVRHQQEGFYSCWAACAEMIMEYLGADRIRQCEQSNSAFNLLKSCADDGVLERGSVGDKQWRPEFRKWGFDFEFRPGYSGPIVALTWPELTTEISDGRPVAFAWYESPGLAHLMVLIGFHENAEDKRVICVDPFYGEDLDPTMVSFADYNGGSDVYEHWGDYFGIRPIGFE